MQFRTLTLHPPERFFSLCWEDDWLVDWAGGGARQHLDGRFQGAQHSYGAAFDAATTHGEFAVVYKRTGTEALLLRHGEVLRELTRDSYRAEACDIQSASGAITARPSSHIVPRPTIESRSSRRRPARSLLNQAIGIPRTSSIHALPLAPTAPGSSALAGFGIRGMVSRSSMSTVHSRTPGAWTAWRPQHSR